MVEIKVNGRRLLMDLVKRFIRCTDFSTDSKQQLTNLLRALKNDYVSHHPGKYALFIGLWYNKQGNLFADIKVNGKVVDTLGIALSTSFFSLNTVNLIDINKKAETMFKEDFSYGLKDEGTLSAIISSTVNTFFGKSNYPGVIKKATMYWYKIATSQVFFNGNKRTALLSALYLLYMNGFCWLNINGNELYEISVKVSTHEMNAADLEAYILEHVGVLFFDNFNDAMRKIDFSFTMPLHIDNPNE